MTRLYQHNLTQFSRKRSHQRARGDSNLRPAVSALSVAFASGRTISSSTDSRGRRALPAASIAAWCGVIAGAAHPLVSTPSVGDRFFHLAPPTARLGITRPLSRTRASPSSPGSPRPVLAACSRSPRAGPLFAEGNRRSIQLSYGRSCEGV